jgi:hypothetical protein
MGDRKPSQFYHDLKILASPFASEQFILILWRNRLPDRLREILSVVDDTNVKKLTRAANRIQEAFSQNRQRANRMTAVIKSPVQNSATSDPVAAAINSLGEQFNRLEMRIDAWQTTNSVDHAHARVHNFTAVRAREIRHGETDYFFTTRSSANAR